MSARLRVLNHHACKCIGAAARQSIMVGGLNAYGMRKNNGYAISMRFSKNFWLKKRMDIARTAFETPGCIRQHRTMHT
jgi:hypothetical protein